jgi:hypothetical protein
MLQNIQNRAIFKNLKRINLKPQIIKYLRIRFLRIVDNYSAYQPIFFASDGKFMQ